MMEMEIYRNIKIVVKFSLDLTWTEILDHIIPFPKPIYLTKYDM